MTLMDPRTELIPVEHDLWARGPVVCHSCNALYPYARIAGTPMGKLYCPHCKTTGAIDYWEGEPVGETVSVH